MVYSDMRLGDDTPKICNYKVVRLIIQSSYGI